MRSQMESFHFNPHRSIESSKSQMRMNKDEHTANAIVELLRSEECSHEFSLSPLPHSRKKNPQNIAYKIFQFKF